MTNTKARAIGSGFLIYFILTIGAFVMIVPFVWMVSTAFKTFQETLAIPIKWFPAKLQLDNFKEVLNRLNFGRYYANTIIVTVSITFFQVLFCSMAAYGFARIKFPGRGVLFIILLSMLMIPQQMTLLPSYILLSKLRWLDTFYALIIPNFFSVYGTFFLRQFFLSLPSELEEAAIIDGSSRWGIYWRIFLPLSTTALAAFGVFTILWAWNDLMWPLIMTSRESIRVLSVGVATLVGQYSTRNHWLMAAAMLATTPMIVMFMFLQKQFIAGISITGLKA
jgi:multiple sugar transport system permease protein